MPYPKGIGLADCLAHGGIPPDQALIGQEKTSRINSPVELVAIYPFANQLKVICAPSVGDARSSYGNRCKWATSALVDPSRQDFQTKDLH
jgi:hypothetical protein